MQLKKMIPIEIRIYPGADCKFTLYEDENDNYNYEKGKYSTIIFKWDDAKKTLTIGDRKGSFPGMIAEHKFNIVRVENKKGIGINSSETFDKVVIYNGKKVVVKL